MAIEYSLREGKVAVFIAKQGGKATYDQIREANIVLMSESAFTGLLNKMVALNLLCQDGSYYTLPPASPYQ